MTITLRLDSETERRLREAATRLGLTVEEHLERLAEQSVLSCQGASPPSADAWETAWRAWAAGHKRLPAAAEDDRDSIYVGRGE